MKPKLFAISAAMILIASTTTNAGEGFWRKVNRHLGYGVSDGYHAQRHCQPAGSPCSNCAPVQQPMILAPTAAPVYWQSAPHQFQSVGQPGYPVAPIYQFYAPNYSQTAMPALASPYRDPAPRW